jgi:hypothetical protein
MKPVFRLGWRSFFVGETHMSEQLLVEKEDLQVSRGDAINLSRSSVERIDAEQVTLHQSVTGQVKAGEVELRQSITGQVSAEQIDLSDSISGALESNTVHMQDSVLLIGRSGETVIQDSAVGVLVTDQAIMDNGTARLVIARQVSGGPIRPLVLLAGKVDGPVEPTLDTPRAVLAGLSAGVAFGLVLWLEKLLSRKK